MKDLDSFLYFLLEKIVYFIIIVVSILVIKWVVEHVAQDVVEEVLAASELRRDTVDVTEDEDRVVYSSYLDDDDED